MSIDRCNCYPFGSLLPGRSYQSNTYRFGFGSHEKDDEWRGITGADYDFGGYGYDALIGRRKCPDPLSAKHPSISPYATFNNNPNLFIDTDGKEWVNAYDAIVTEKQKALLDNPNSRKLKRQLAKAQENQTKVNEIINNLKENDIALYNYIENLTVKDAKTGENINVKVTVSLGYRSGRDKTEDASTKYRNADSQGKRKYIKYEGLEGKYDITFAPLDENDEVGFNVTLFSTPEWADVYLSNEAGDVMFRIEYPDAAYNSGSDANKTYDDYIKKGTAGNYSYKVEDMYKKRKKEKQKTGKKSDTNPYPLKQ